MILIVGAVVLVIGWRLMSKLKPLVETAGKWGDDIGGWTIFWVFGGQAVKRFMSTGARVLLISAWFLVALFWKPARVVLFIWLAWRLLVWWSQRRQSRATIAQRGFDNASELKVISKCTTQALLSLKLGAKVGDEIVPPRLFAWRKQPIVIGKRRMRGEYRYECRVEPAPGSSMAQMMDYAGRGLDADDDRIRDNVNSYIRNAHGRDAEVLGKSVQRPQFVLTTLDHVTTRRSEKTGLGRLTLWTTDPFSQMVHYPYDPAKPVVRHFSDPVPIGLLRTNTESSARLDAQTSVQGINGSGKSTVVRPALIAAAHTNAVIVIMALKGPNDYDELRNRFAGGVVITDPLVARRVLDAANTEVQRRNHLRPEDRDAERPVWLVLDEGQELGDDIHAITPIVKKGRSANVWLWSVTQYGLTSIIPSEAAREMGQRFAGRIEGGVNQAQVAVGSRAGRNKGPHLIPEDRRWRGVLFGSDGQFVRVYWVTAESKLDRPSLLSRCAAACPARPEDPAWFTDALRSNVPVLPPLELPQWPMDGAKRAPSGEALGFETEQLQPEVLAAVERVWQVAGKTTVPLGWVTTAVARRTLTAATKRLQRSEPDSADMAAVDLVEMFLSRPLIAAAVNSQEADT